MIRPGEPSASAQATQLLNALGTGDAAVAAELMPLVYAELRAMAGGMFRGERPDHTLQPTALVHEAFIRLVGSKDQRWESRAHFFAVAAKAMRNTLVNHAMARNADKRGGGRSSVVLDLNVAAAQDQREFETLALDEALRELAALDVRKASVIEMRFFGGMTVDEVAHVLGASVSTIEADWRMARAWLSQRLAGC